MTQAMRKQSIITLALGLLVMASCGQKTAVQEEELREIKFTASVGAFAKATATAFEEGDRAGITIEDPVSVSNMELTYEWGAFVPEHPLFWPREMSSAQSAVFIAYYPYAFSATVPSFDVTRTWSVAIGSAQYKPEVFQQQDFLSAIITATPADASVDLPFKHLMSRFNITILDQQETETFTDVQTESFQSVEIQQLYTSALITFSTQEASADPDAGKSYSFFPARTGTKTYSLILPPQTASPHIEVQFASGNKMSFDAVSPIVFPAGKAVSAKLVLSNDGSTLEDIQEGGEYEW